LSEVIGDLNDLTGTPIFVAEELSNKGIGPQNDTDESYTWTFYNLTTMKGSVTLRWYGSNNGCYSERINI
jgi:hypothetical protein